MYSSKNCSSKLNFQDENAPFPHVYTVLGWDIPKYLVSVGAMCGLFSR